MIQIGFTVTIKNNGTGLAKGATGSDTLPAGIAWTIDGAANGWSISPAGVLTFGPADLAAGASATVHVIGNHRCRRLRSRPEHGHRRRDQRVERRVRHR